MSKFEVNKFEDAKKSDKRNFYWNLISSIINALEAVFILFISARCISLEESGYYVFGFLFGNLIMCIGKFGVRNFHSSDVVMKFSFSEYKTLRFFSILLTLPLFIFYLIFDSNSLIGYKKLIVLFISLIYLIEANEDVYAGEFHRRNRLDIGCKLFSLRWTAILLVWGLCLVITKDALISVIIPLIFSFLIHLTMVFFVKKKYLKIKFFSFNFNRTLIKNIVPLFFSSLFMLFIPNTSKYAIELYLPSSYQAIYGYISMPIFVLDVLVCILMQPVIPMISECFNKNLFEFKSIIVKRGLIILVFSLVFLMFGVLLEGKVLFLLYKTDLTPYFYPMVTLLFCAILLGFNSFFIIILTVMREQNKIMIIYTFTFFLSFISFGFVKKHGIWGASFSTGIVLAILCFSLFIITRNKMRKNGFVRK